VLAMHVGDLARDGRLGSHSGWPEGALPESAGWHERHSAAQTPELTRRLGATQ
jgi:hypothetical protein